MLPEPVSEPALEPLARQAEPQPGQANGCVSVLRRRHMRLCHLQADDWQLD